MDNDAAATDWLVKAVVVVDDLYAHEFLPDLDSESIRIAVPGPEHELVDICAFAVNGASPFELGIAATLIWSREDAEKRGLLDILPRRANKLEAIRFLTGMVELDESRVVFAGDSGNDLEPLTSGLKAILVKNAASDVHQAVMDHLSREGKTDCLYRAKGGFGGMNGNYAAGVVEGVVHFFPEATDWIASVLNQSLDDGL